MLDEETITALSRGYAETIAPAVEAEAELLEAALLSGVVLRAQHGPRIMDRLIADAGHAEKLIRGNTHHLGWNVCQEARDRLRTAIVAAGAASLAERQRRRGGEEPTVETALGTARDPRIDPKIGDVLWLDGSVPVRSYLPGGLTCLVTALGADDARVVGDQVQFSWMNTGCAAMAYETLTIVDWRELMANATVLRVAGEK